MAEGTRKGKPTAKKEATYIQVGVTSVRDPVTGNLIQSTPLYIKSVSGAEELKEDLADEIGLVFAHQIRDYILGCREAGINK